MKKYFFALILCFVSNLTAFALPQVFEGINEGAAYKIIVPENWNGTLFLYAHGYRDLADHPGEVDIKIPEVVPYNNPETQLKLIQKGFAIAGSAYRFNGWAVDEGAQDTLRLKILFKELVGEKPKRVILWGDSMGSLVALKSVETLSNAYDGVIAACHLGAGVNKVFDRTINFLMAFDILFGMPKSWGTPGDLRDDLDFNSEVLPYFTEIMKDESNMAKMEFMRTISYGNGKDPEIYYNPSSNASIFYQLYFGTEARAQLERKMGGPFVDNTNTIYGLTAQESDYLQSLGLKPGELLNKMNTTKYEGKKDLRSRLELSYVPTGAPLVPLITISNLQDLVTPTEHTTVYNANVVAHHREEFYLPLFATNPGHCLWSPNQVIAVVDQMYSWLINRQKPDAESFPKEFGFVAHTPGDWR
jgi:hypothetical protein